MEIGAACQERSTMGSLQNGVCRSNHKRNYDHLLRVSWSCSSPSSNGWENILHSVGDQVKRVDVPSLYVGYRFALALVAELHELPCNAGRK